MVNEKIFFLLIGIGIGCFYSVFIIIMVNWAIKRLETAALNAVSDIFGATP